ncbi:MAG: hypothetical protein JXR37_29790 [Kiritimatiellae bacterium]|nr:hypothetical protein [Kiritimatiellia bacterium]
MRITSDWHIHSRNSCDSACMLISDLVTEARAAGITDLGLTDHIHTPYNLPDLARSREEYLSVSPSPRFHFGVEVSCVSQWELDELASGRYEDTYRVYGLRRAAGPAGGPAAIGLTAEDKAQYAVEYVVGGTHWPLYVPMDREAVIRDYHRQNLFLATHPLVDVVAHPWWWMGHWKDDDGNYSAEPWFDDFNVIPASMHEEFAAAAIEHGKAVEINLSAILLNRHYPERFRRQYAEYLAALQAKGVSLSIGSDCHAAHYGIDFESAARLLEEAGVRDEFWGLPPCLRVR